MLLKYFFNRKEKSPPRPQKDDALVHINMSCSYLSQAVVTLEEIHSHLQEKKDHYQSELSNARDKIEATILQIILNRERINKLKAKVELYKYNKLEPLINQDKQEAVNSTMLQHGLSILDNQVVCSFFLIACYGRLNSCNFFLE